MKFVAATIFRILCWFRNNTIQHVFTARRYLYPSLIRPADIAHPLLDSYNKMQLREQCAGPDAGRGAGVV